MERKRKLFQGIVPREYGTLGGRGHHHHHQHHQHQRAEPAYQDLQQGTETDHNITYVDHIN